MTLGNAPSPFELELWRSNLSATASALHFHVWARRTGASICHSHYCFAPLLNTVCQSRWRRIFSRFSPCDPDQGMPPFSLLNSTSAAESDRLSVQSFPSVTYEADILLRFLCSGIISNSQCTTVGCWRWSCCNTHIVLGFAYLFETVVWSLLRYTFPKEFP